MPPPPTGIERYNLDKLLKDTSTYAKSISIENLEELIIILKDYYYNTDTPLVPDSIFDQLEDILRKQKPHSYALIQVGSPSQGADTPLPYPMASQNKAKAGEGTIDRWLRNYSGPYVVSHKIDGISLMYHKVGNKVQLLTRGNGLKGQDVSQLVRYLDLRNKSKSKFQEPHELTVRGELIMEKKVWDQHYADDYPNVRNYVSGAVNRSRKDPQPTDLKRIKFVAYQLISPEMPPSEQFKYLQQAGFYVAPHVVEAHLDEAELQLKLDYARQHGPYQIDGLIVSQDHYVPPTDSNPKTSIAFKSQTEEIAQTTVIKVIWKASKRFLLKPRVIIEPVFLSGGNLTRATGHHAKYIVDHNIGPGAVVTIIRSGDVIPYVVKVNKPADYPDLPEIDYEWDEDGLNIRVTEETEEVSHSILIHLAKTLELAHLGPGTILKLVQMGYTTPAELLNITLEELREVPGLGRNADKIWDSLTKLETEGVWLSQLMGASSMFETGVGQRIMQLVLDHYPDLLDMIDDPQLINKLVKIKGIERKTADKIVEGLPIFQEFLDQVPHIRIKDEDDSDDTNSYSEETNPALDGLRVIFTGVRNKELEKLITSSGGEVATSVAKTHTNQVVVAKDPSSQSNKLKTAKKQKIPILSLEEFINQYT